MLKIFGGLATLTPDLFLEYSCLVPHTFIKTVAEMTGKGRRCERPLLTSADLDSILKLYLEKDQKR